MAKLCSEIDAGSVCAGDRDPGGLVSLLAALLRGSDSPYSVFAHIPVGVPSSSSYYHLPLSLEPPPPSLEKSSEWTTIPRSWRATRDSGADSDTSSLYPWSQTPSGSTIARGQPSALQSQCKVKAAGLCCDGRVSPGYACHGLAQLLDPGRNYTPLLNGFTVLKAFLARRELNPGAERRPEETSEIYPYLIDLCRKTMIYIVWIRGWMRPYAMGVLNGGVQPQGLITIGDFDDPGTERLGDVERVIELRGMIVVAVAEVEAETTSRALVVTVIAVHVKTQAGSLTEGTIHIHEPGALSGAGASLRHPVLLCKDETVIVMFMMV
ncbi:hypothetical protein B0H17DRAFT_1137879 [Mycena rosella]|uniref:Uncharacterized protein n=1 Tax=Mycena rosella TaxID=1033263 RepID=A0AAD7D824_MYCRO|nr:hypothetical protein B0H17DRAFT_1137879 [Mycena rosella]